MAKPDVEALKAAAKAKAARAREDMKAAKVAKAMPRYYDMPKQSGDPERDSEADLSELQAGFRKRAKDEGRRFEQATDTEYWACLCFQTREQKEAFLKALNLLAIGDKYLDGQEVAKVLGVELPSADVPYNTSSKKDSAWTEFVD